MGRLGEGCGGGGGRLCVLGGGRGRRGGGGQLGIVGGGQVVCVWEADEGRKEGIG